MNDNTTQLKVLNSNDVPDVLHEVQQAFFDIPFDNSMYQTNAFVVAAQITPERAYRAIGLQMNSKLQAILEFKRSRAKEDIDIEELRETISSWRSSKFEKRRAKIDLEFKLANRPFSDKLLNDALVELNVLYRHFKSLPRYTRAQFEAGEEKHFTEKLTRQVKGIVGAQEAIVNMSGDLPSMLSFETQVEKQLVSK